MAIFIIFSTSMIYPFDFGPDIILGQSNFDYSDIAIFGLQIIFVSLFNISNLFLNDDERDFINYLSSLHSVYYKSFVVPAIRRFNFIVKNSSLIDEIKAVESERERFKENIINDVKNLIEKEMKNFKKINESK